MADYQVPVFDLGEPTHNPVVKTKEYTEDGVRCRITVHIEYKLLSGNKYPYFAITGDIREHYGHGWREGSGGCIHEDIAKRFPEYAHLIPFHLWGPDARTQVGNAVYLGNDRDCWGLRKGEKRQIINGRTGKPSWVLIADSSPCTDFEYKEYGSNYFDGDEPPKTVPVMKWVPWCRVGEGKEPDFDAARRCANWPDATEEDIMSEDFAQKIIARLPALYEEFRKHLRTLGLVKYVHTPTQGQSNEATES